MMTYNEDDAKAIIKYLSSKGFTPEQTCGVMGNLYTESKFRADNAQNSYMTKFGITDEDYVRMVDNGTWKRPDTGDGFTTDKIGMGIAQWTSSGRKNGMYNSIKSKGLSIADLQGQLDFMWEELCGGYKNTLNALRKATTIEEATCVFAESYEKPASIINPDTREKAEQVRISYAKELYDKYFGAGEFPKVLAISAGHYLYTAGKRCPKELDPNETREWVLNARIADKLTVILNRYKGIKILRLDDPTGEKAITIQERAQISDANNADFYLAIHHNAAGRIFSGGGVVVYHYHYERNKAEATAMYNTLVAHNGLRGNRANPIVNNDSLYEVGVPNADSLLVENGFMDSTVDCPIILTDDYAQKSAEGMAEFFVNFWNLQLKEDEAKADILAEIEAIDNNIAALQKRRAELESML